MARLAFQQDKLNLAIFIQVPVRVRFPVLGNQIALNYAGLFRISPDVVCFIVAIQRLAGRFFVKEYHRHILATGFIDYRTRRCGHLIMRYVTFH